MITKRMFLIIFSIAIFSIHGSSQAQNTSGHKVKKPDQRWREKFSQAEQIKFILETDLGEDQTQDYRRIERLCEKLLKSAGYELCLSSMARILLMSA